MVLRISRCKLLMDHANPIVSHERVFAKHTRNLWSIESRLCNFTLRFVAGNQDSKVYVFFCHISSTKGLKEIVHIYSKLHNRSRQQMPKSLQAKCYCLIWKAQVSYYCQAGALVATLGVKGRSDPMGWTLWKVVCGSAIADHRARNLRLYND